MGLECKASFIPFTDLCSRVASLTHLERQHAHERRSERRPAAVRYTLRLTGMQQRIDWPRATQLLDRQPRLALAPEG